MVNCVDAYDCDGSNCCANAGGGNYCNESGFDGLLQTTAAPEHPMLRSLPSKAAR